MLWHWVQAQLMWEGLTATSKSVLPPYHWPRMKSYNLLTMQKAIIFTGLISITNLNLLIIFANFKEFKEVVKKHTKYFAEGFGGSQSWCRTGWADVLKCRVLLSRSLSGYSTTIHHQQDHCLQSVSRLTVVWYGILEANTIICISYVLFNHRCSYYNQFTGMFFLWSLP